ncbi:fumarylacetoacetate hydrolase domain-containing protein 2A [Callorhinchus milii]|uniref:Fumarylacetoacetate hydrolase domain containing 2A n=1 Tax=Callorhinchus milii TaxID=7868 RepID=V9KVI1_CALMI|nr:fumarylacetoacetate hydrolase domain-containing protein 2A [Callorhinchus milii]XP_007905609.1 fumarylacetoacetate hydrolase domain-containing protein 2A [Callorhinchus milii]|eukprot:gi/632977905/ref/XP_007905608.1/ PREDICTED: fumarylacetoacetate hydrolase domain-containing protein 2A-like [Callorhinchus milii]
MQVRVGAAPLLLRLLRAGRSGGAGPKPAGHFQARPLSPSGERGMRLVQFRTAREQDGVRVGVEEKDGGNVVDLNWLDSSLPRTMREFLEKGEAAMASARRAVNCRTVTLSRSEVTFLSPVTNPDKVVCVGMNYLDHCQEQNVPLPKEPVIFSKFGSSIVGPYSDIIHPAESNEVDWEVELAFVIGKKGKHIKREEAMDHVAGYTVAHDVSARDWQLKRNGKQWLLGKTFDTFCPLGPALVTKDAISDPHNLGIRCRVNGKVMQDSNTNQLIFNTEALVVWISQFVTLYPGDVVLTGTPSGVGVFRKPPVFLRRGDTVECEIDEIGTLRNTVV